MLWLAIYLPKLPLEVFTRSWIPVSQSGLQAKLAARPPSGHILPEGPSIAVCNRLQILQSNELAQALGVSAGIKRATAQALAPDILLLDRDPTRETQSLEHIAIWLLQFTPQVSIRIPYKTNKDPPCGLVLEIEPSLKLFGGKDTIMTIVRSGLIEQGYDAAIACAPTATGAWWLAQSQPGVSVDQFTQFNAKLAGVPISVIESARDHLGILYGLGVQSLKDLAQLPRTGLARRFGPSLLKELDQALGRLPEPLEPIRAPQTFDLKLELLAQVENAQALLFGAKRMVLMLTGWLSALHAGVRQFSLLALHDDHEPTDIHIELADASRDPNRLILLLRERLDKIQLPEPAHSLQLQCLEICALGQTNDQLFPNPAQAHEGLSRLVERLQSRLGKEHVQQLLVAPDHRPEAAYILEPIRDLSILKKKMLALKSAKTPSLKAQEPDQTYQALNNPDFQSNQLPRPLWLLQHPIVIHERQNRPWFQGPLHLLAGPERIEGGWWDGNFVQRDYFIAEDDEAALYWIFSTRGTDGVGSSSWHVQGMFG
jgi:protein ImuB